MRFQTVDQVFELVVEWSSVAWHGSPGYEVFVLARSSLSDYAVPRLIALEKAAISDNRGITKLDGEGDAR